MRTCDPLQLEYRRIYSAPVMQLGESSMNGSSDPSAWYRAGASQLAAGALNEGKQSLLRAVELAPDDIGLCSTVAELFSANGFHAEASTLFQHLLELAPENVEICLALAQSLERSGALEDAVEHARNAAALSPEHVDAQKHLGRIFGKLGNVAGCLRAWQRAVELTASADAEALSALGIAQSHAGQHEAAIGTLHSVVDFSPISASAHADLGMAFLAAGAADEALDSFARAVSLEPVNAQAHLGMGIAQHKLSRLEDSAKELSKATQLAPNWSVAFYDLGLALSELGRLDEARQALLRAAALDPDDRAISEALEEVILLRTTGTTSGDASSVHGHLSTFALPDLLEFLRVGRKTGALMVASRRGAGVIRLFNGELTSASAPGTRRLGELLVERGLISVDVFNGALAEQSESQSPENPEPLGSVLVRKGMLSPRALQDVVFQQIISALSELLSWPDGNFSFQSKVTGDGAPPTMTFDLQRALLETLRIQDENARNAGARRGK